MRLTPVSIRLFRSITSVIILFAASTTFVFAQGGVGSTRGLPETSGGTNMLEGRVRLPTGRPAGQGIPVKLEGIMVASRRTNTDQDGAFVFRSLPSGEYVLSVEESAEYDAVRQSVSIQGTAGGAREGNSMQVISADLHLRPRLEADPAVFLGVPKEAVDEYKKGTDAARGGNSKKAVEHFKSAVTLAPTFTQAYSELGVQYLKLGDMEHLVEAMTTLIKLSPKDARAHLNLGIALYNQKKFDEAQAHLREAIGLNGAEPASHYYLGMTLVSLRQYEEAEKELELTIKNGGDNLALAHKYLGGLYMSSKKIGPAADELERYLKLDPKAADADRIKETIKDLRDKQKRETQSSDKKGRS
jgi:Tfp pilus assembly protein PilF